MIGDETFYQYDYVITMKNVNGTTLIDSVKLNEYFKTTAPHRRQKQRMKRSLNRRILKVRIEKVAMKASK